MSYPNEIYMIPQGLMYKGVLTEIKKSKESLQPFFEAFTNAWEAIQLKRDSGETFEPAINIKIYSTQTTDSRLEFAKLSIHDNGIGFNDTEFQRFNNYKDYTKGFKNLGSGRIQYVHHFVKSNVVSVYKGDNNLRKREFILSKDDEFLAQNAIVFHKSDEVCDTVSETGTTITFSSLLDPRSMIYHNLTDEDLKNRILDRYMQLFCLNKPIMPTIKIQHFVHNDLLSENEIGLSDVPSIDKSLPISINYSTLSPDGRRIIHIDRTEEFTINAFKVDKRTLKENRIRLTSKHEVVESVEFEIDLISKSDVIDDFRFLFLIASEYIDERDTDTRGDIRIPRREDFEKTLDIFGTEEILLEDIQGNVNNSLAGMYPEIEALKSAHDLNFKKLKEMFLLPEESAYSITISVNDSEKKILEKFYKSEAKKEADLDANIKTQIDRLNMLDPASEDYQEQLSTEVEQLVQVLPMQNKINLTHYVARRKLVLELFDKVLNARLRVQNDGSRNNNEALLHNILFQQSSSNPEISDLWLLNEDYVYFDGCSEQKLRHVTVDGVSLLRNNLTTEEEDYRTSLGEDRFSKRPDILLFPEESKCIIIEFKRPDVSISDHLNQIQNYASLLLHFTREEFKVDTFYGYFIGENIDPRDVRSYEPEFIPSYKFDFLFRPSRKVADVLGHRRDGEIYTEVIKYSTLLQRAKKRNEIFINKPTKTASAFSIEEVLAEESVQLEE